MSASDIASESKTAGHRRLEFQNQLWVEANRTQYGKALRRLRTLRAQAETMERDLAAMAEEPKHARGRMLDQAWALAAVAGDWERALNLAQQLGLQTPTLEALTD